MLKPFILFCLFCLFTFSALSSQAQYLTNHAELLPGYTPSNRPRMAAEWEPALGTLIAWPLSIPHKLVIELAKQRVVINFLSG